MLNTAIIGVSGFAQHHYADLLRLSKEGVVKVCAATIVNQAEEVEKVRVLREMGCEIFTDYREMLDAWKDRLVLCIIPTGIHLHARMAIRALQAGCHVFIEKPAAATVQEVDAMAEAERETSRFVAVGYQHLYAPEVHRMKRAICDGAIGAVQAIKCKGLWPRADSYYLRNNWAGRLKVGEDWVLDSPFNNAFAHWLNLLCFLSGTEPEQPGHPKEVQTELYRTRPIETADTACLKIETEEAIPLLLWVTHSCRKLSNDDPVPELEVRGSDGSFLWTSQGIIHRPRDGKEALWPASTFFQMREAMLDAVIGKILGKESFVCGLEIARMQTICSNAAFQSSKVEEISPQFCSPYQRQGERFVAIEEIETLFSRAFDQEKLLGEMHVPWARSGRKVVVAGITAPLCLSLEEMHA